MKIISVLLGCLFVGGIGYLYLQPDVPAAAISVANIEVPETSVGERCVGTACAPSLETKEQMDMAIDTEIVKISDEVDADKAVEKKLITTEKKSIETKAKTPVPTQAPAYPRYTEFVNPSGYVNSEPFMLADVVGKKIIVLEFITYSCINCQRTFPFMKQWHETYAKDGVLVVGIHTPEFSYERDRDNVVAAMKKEGITFPIVMDNDYASWNAYNNRFWPRRYVIDLNGNVVFDHIGEGAYVETEAVIQKLLQIKAIGG
jgi:thiol-disulfide isomerase/thioredoxin